MLIDRLDRTQWRLSQAIDHVAAQIERAIARGDIAPASDPTVPPWRRSENPRGGVASQAAREVQVALRDGDLHAQGRLSTTQSRPWTHALDGWDLHSGHHSTITPEQWRAGRTDVQLAVLTMADGQFIDIRVPRFMVLAIWPVIEVPQLAPAVDPKTGEPYRTPYMDLLERAIAENRISMRDQGKKELLADWFREQTVDGEPVSQNLADAMATLIRLPGSQRGGAKRGWG
ncbi:hypothetical protein [Falsiroseomonas ponticola]|uniref:hypothetical protein n=1 Tax=Falsiroseomonas ponticola TaxID=2786951 RepID=UPI00193366EB|nr:hypothetical protein [Roseomonas ponticola]